MGRRLGGIGEALADRNFAIYSLGSSVSWLTFFVQWVAMSWSTWELTHSTGWLATVALLDIAPNAVFVPLGGVIADRFDRFHVVLVAYAAATLQSLALTGLAATGQLAIGWLCLLAFLHGLIHSFSVPAGYGLFPRFVRRDRLASAIAVNAAYTQFALFAGPALAGWIIARFGVTVAFASNVAGYLIYFAAAAFLRTPPDHAPPPAKGGTILGNLADGARYIAGHRGIRALLLLMLAGDALSTATYQMLPAFADTLLGQGVQGVSTLLAAAGIGATASALWIAHGGAGRMGADRVLWAFGAFALSVAALAWTSHIALAAAIMLGFGFAGELRRTGTVSLLQLTVRDDQRGRVMATQFLFQRVSGGLGVMAVGAFAEHAGLRWPLFSLAALALCGWAAAMLRRAGIRAAFEPAPPAPESGAGAGDVPARP